MNFKNSYFHKKLGDNEIFDWNGTELQINKNYKNNLMNPGKKRHRELLEKSKFECNNIRSNKKYRLNDVFTLHNQNLTITIKCN